MLQVTCSAGGGVRSSKQRWEPRVRSKGPGYNYRASHSLTGLRTVFSRDVLEVIQSRKSQLTFSSPALPLNRSEPSAVCGAWRYDLNRPSKFDSSLPTSFSSRRAVSDFECPYASSIGHQRPPPSGGVSGLFFAFPICHLYSRFRHFHHSWRTRKHKRRYG